MTDGRDVMAITADIRSDAEHMEILERLIAERGIGRHGLFLLTGEGRFTPDGFEETSGYVIGEHDRSFFFWTGWDAGAEQTAFKIWRVAEPQTHWWKSAEYRAARVAAGLT